MRSAGVSVIFTAVSPRVERLLRAHKVIRDETIDEKGDPVAGDVVISALDDALEWCEEQVLLRYEKGITT